MRCLQHSGVRLNRLRSQRAAESREGSLSTLKPPPYGLTGSVSAMHPFGEKTSTEVFELLSTLHEQLEAQENVTRGWRRDLESQIRDLEDQLTRIQNRLNTLSL